MSGLIKRIISTIGISAVLWRAVLQAICYVWFFSQPFLLQTLLSNMGSGESVSAVLLALLAGSLMMPVAIDCSNNYLLQAFRKHSKAIVAKRLMSQECQYFVDHTSAEVQSYVNEISFSCRKVEDSFVHTVLKVAVMVVLYTTSMVGMSPIVGMAYLAFIMAYLFLSVRLTRANRGNIKKSLASTSGVSERLQDIHNNISTIITSRARNNEFQVLDSLLGKEQKAYSITQSYTNGVAFIQQLMIVAFAAALLVFSQTSGALAGSLETSLLTLVYSIMNLTGFGPQYLLIREMLDRGNAALKSLDFSSDSGVEDYRVFDPLASCLEFADVSFSFGGDSNVLRSLTVRIPKGSLSAVVGPNGSGKSTLLKMGAGLLAPFSGTVTLPVGQESPVMYLDQSAILFNRSLLENICYGIEPPENLMSLVHEVGLDSVIRSKEQLCQLTPGSLSGKMSGGEQQKVLILRALVTKPEVLFCDEITSALDSASSRTFYKMLRAYLPKATVVCTVHKSQELEHFDHVFKIA